MRYLALTSLLFIAVLASSQDSALDKTRSADSSRQPDEGQLGESGRINLNAIRPKKVPNPFDEKPNPKDTMGSMEMGGGEFDMGTMSEMMSEYGSATSPDQVFRHGLQRAIEAIKEAKTDDEKAILRGYVRSAFANRYDDQIQRRQKDLDRLKQSVAKLEGDLKRRAAAKDRVVELQLQSVQLAAEGLLELNELQGLPNNTIGRSGFSAAGEDRDSGMGMGMGRAFGN